MNFLQVAGKDIKSIFKNRIIRVSVIAIIVVPLLYSLLYLDAFWDPYSKLDDLPIAVVNQDTGAMLDGEDVCYGQDLVDNLKENTVVAWKFVSNEEADKGLNGDKYYAKFVIPKNFSSDIIAAKETAPKVANLQFVCNEKKNFLASQINSKVESELKGEIVKTITNNYVTVAFDKLYEAKDGTIKAADGSKQIYDGLAILNDKVPTLEEGVNKLDDGSNRLLNGQVALNSAIGQINGGLSELNGKVPTLSNGINSLYSGSEELSNGGDKLYKVFNGTVYPSVEKLKNGVNGMNASLEKGKDAINTLHAGVAPIKDGSDKLSKASNSIKNGYDNVKGGVDKLIAGSVASSKVMGDVSEDLKKAMGSTNEAEKNANIMAALQKMKSYSDANKDAPNKIKELKEGSENLSKGINEFNGRLDEYTKKVNEFSNGTETLIGKVNLLSKGINEVDSGLTALDAGLNEKNSGSFGDGLKRVSNGADKINAGLGEVNSNIPSLAGGASALYNGSNQILTGSNELVNGQTALNDGINSLSSNVPTLKDGVEKLYDGSNELYTKLDEGAEKMKSGLVNSPETMGNFVSEPVNMENAPINPVPNYGTGFAPYFISLSLWIGAIMMFFVIPSKTDDDENTSKFSKVFGKFLSFGFVGILQALLIAFVVLALGLKPTNLPLYIGLIIFFSLVFIAIVQCFIFLFGDAGRLLSIVLLILQLTACAGTFPLEVVPKFFKTINPYMPFTYTVEALRETISATTINYAVIGKATFILGCTLVVFLGVSILLKNVGEKMQEVIEGRKKEALEGDKNTHLSA